MRLIDADAAKKSLRLAEIDAVNRSKFRAAFVFNAMYNLIDVFSTLDFKTVKHGKWIITPNGMGRNINTGKMLMSYNCDCSICGFHTGNQGLGFRYCPNCGAKMEGGEKQ